jgi:hypothetical protein
MSRFLGIRREAEFSPGKVDADRAILDLSAARLQARGHVVEVCNAADDTWPDPAAGAVVFTMAQGARALQRLRQWAARGVRIINHPEGILNCQRHRTVAAFAETDLPFPDTVLLATDAAAPLPGWIGDHGAWIKRGDVHATEADDVVYVADAAAVRQALRRFSARNIAAAVVQRHVGGTVLKFYAVRGRFFHCVAPPPGVEIPAAVERGIDALGRCAADILNVEIYGGDCVVGMNGELTLIDLNDWPSYAACRALAAESIAAHLIAQTEAKES